jgi:CYTH domain-containing protein
MIEKERKFILKHMPELGDYFKKPKMIKQGYLMLDGSQQLRVRIINDYDSYIAYKNKIDEFSKDEFEFKIPYADALRMYESCRFRLEKKRYSTIYKDYRIDIDIYPSGKQVVEVEYEEELNEIPEYCGTEVTGNKEYSNIFIAKQNNEIFPTENV